MNDAAKLSELPIANNQIEFHPYLDQKVVARAANDLGISVTGYYPMADGKVFDDAVLKEIAQGIGRSVAQVVLRRIVQQGFVALSKTVSEERALANAAIFDFELSSEHMSRISSLAQLDGRIVSPSGLAPKWDAE